eukprot:gene1942-7962_t
MEHRPSAAVAGFVPPAFFSKRSISLTPGTGEAAPGKAGPAPRPLDASSEKKALDSALSAAVTPAPRVDPSRLLNSRTPQWQPPLSLVAAGASPPSAALTAAAPPDPAELLQRLRHHLIRAELAAVRERADATEAKMDERLRLADAELTRADGSISGLREEVEALKLEARREGVRKALREQDLQSEIRAEMHAELRELRDELRDELDDERDELAAFTDAVRTGLQAALGEGKLVLPSGCTP